MRQPTSDSCMWGGKATHCSDIRVGPVFHSGTLYFQLIVREGSPYKAGIEQTEALHTPCLVALQMSTTSAACRLLTLTEGGEEATMGWTLCRGQASAFWLKRLH